VKLLPLISKAVLFVAFALLGFWLADTLYFAKHPLFGISYFAQVIVALFCGALGSGGVPRLWEGVRRRFLEIIRKTVYKAVSDFWTQRSLQARERRRLREQSKKKAQKRSLDFGGATPVVVDTSALIDGRIAEVVKTGFLDNPLLVPQFVLDELQKIADSENDLKRQRGRRGLEILEELSKAKIGRRPLLRIIAADRAAAGVDKALVTLAKKVRGKIATVDFNLNKVASVSKVAVLNVNELVNAIKASVLPGEVLGIKVIQEGKEPGQGVGYLNDGTMVVVENGQMLIGKTVRVEVSRIIQTAAGRMIFSVPLKPTT